MMALPRRREAEAFPSYLVGLTASSAASGGQEASRASEAECGPFKSPSPKNILVGLSLKMLPKYTL